MAAEAGRRVAAPEQDPQEEEHGVASQRLRRRRTSTSTALIARETSSEPAQPSRLLKKKNIVDLDREWAGALPVPTRSSGDHASWGETVREPPHSVAVTLSSVGA